MGENNMESGDNHSKDNIAHLRWFVTGSRENLESKTREVHSDIIDLGLTWSNKEATKTLALHQRGQAISWGHYAPKVHLFKRKKWEVKSVSCFCMSDLPSWNVALPLLTGSPALQILWKLQSLEAWASGCVGWCFPRESSQVGSQSNNSLLLK